jgi:ATP-dependent DNA helicase RecG
MLNETEYTEFKPKFNEDVVETLVAFSNTKGGRVLVGVDDDGKPLKNFAIGKETLQDLVNKVKTNTQPQIIPDVDFIEIDGKEIIEFRIQEYPVKPVATRGRYYKRVKNSNHLLSLSEVVNLHLQTLNTSWDAYPDNSHNLDDISIEKVQAAIEVMKAGGLTVNETPIDFLRKKDLLREGHLTNAAYLLFKTNDSFLTTIELGRFQTPIIIKDTARTKADLLTEIEDVMTFVRKHTNKRMIFTGEPRRIEKWQYPMEAIREIVINMIIHRDYRSTADSVVKIFDNKIEFYNPGKLPDEITIESLLSGNYKSNPRNKLLADVCKDMRIIEKYGSGIGRICDYFKRDGLPEPKFELISDGFQVTVFAWVQETIQETIQETGGNVRKIIMALGNKNLSVNELMRAMNLKNRSSFVPTYLTPAIKAGYIAMLYSDNPKHRNQKYFLTDKGKAAIEE